MHRHFAVEKLLSEFYTATGDSRGQRYEPATIGGDRSPEEAIMTPTRVRERANYAFALGVLAEVPAEHRAIVRWVYAWRTDAMSTSTDTEGDTTAGKPTGLIVDSRNVADKLGLLRVALTPSFVRGSLLRLAARDAKAILVFRRRYPALEPTPVAVLDFLAFEAGRGEQSAAMLANVRSSCEETLEATLDVVEAIRAVHAKAAKERPVKEAYRRQEAADEQLEKAAESRRLGRPIAPCLRGITDEMRRAALEMVAAAERLAS